MPMPVPGPEGWGPPTRRRRAGEAGHARRGTARGHVRRGRGDAAEHARRGHGGSAAGGRGVGAVHRLDLVERELRSALRARLLLLLLVLLLELLALELERRLALLERGERRRGSGRRAHQVLRSDEVGPARGLVGEVGGHLRVGDAEGAGEDVAHVAARGDVHLLHLVELEGGRVILEVAAQLLAVRLERAPEEASLRGLLLRPAEKASTAARAKDHVGGRCGRQSRDEGKTVPNAVSGFRRARATDRARRGRSIARGVSRRARSLRDPTRRKPIEENRARHAHAI